MDQLLCFLEFPIPNKIEWKIPPVSLPLNCSFKKITKKKEIMISSVKKHLNVIIKRGAYVIMTYFDQPIKSAKILKLKTDMFIIVYLYVFH